MANTNTIWTSAFWKDAAERAFFTALQVLLALLTVNGTNVANLDVGAIALAIGIAVLGVIVKAGVASQFGGTVSPASLAPDDRGL